MGFIVEYFLCCMDEISDDDDFGYDFFAACLIDTASNSKELCFSTSDKSCMVNYLNQWMVAYVNMRY